MPQKRPHIVVAVDHFLPGVRFGGPVRSVSGVVDLLNSAGARVSVLTQDHDLGEAAAYDEASVLRARETIPADIFYLSDDDLSLGKLRDLLQRLRPDALYLNSLFSRVTLRLLWAVRQSSIAVVLAPRGELDPGALSIKPIRKRSYASALRHTGLARRLTWHATSFEEVDWISGQMAASEDRIILSENPFHCSATIPDRSQPKQANSADLVFISRVSQKKNLPFLLDRLEEDTVRGARLSIYGPTDEPHWTQIKRRYKSLFDSDVARYKGPLTHEEVGAVLVDCDYAVLPTLGENFGHSVAEALASATPVIISDRTPWTSSRLGSAGWALSLEDPEAWRSALRQAVAIGPEAHDVQRAAAHRVARVAASNSTSGIIVDHLLASAATSDP